MKFYALKIKRNGDVSIRCKLDGQIIEVCRLSRRNFAPNAPVYTSEKSAGQSKGFISLENELSIVLQKWLGAYDVLPTTNIVKLNDNELKDLHIFVTQHVSELHSLQYKLNTAYSRDNDNELLETVKRIVKDINSSSLLKTAGCKDVYQLCKQKQRQLSK